MLLPYPTPHMNEVQPRVDPSCMGSQLRNSPLHTQVGATASIKVDALSVASSAAVFLSLLKVLCSN